MGLAAVFFDLGDVIMREESEEKVDEVTQRAELVPGMGDLLHELHATGAALALVADTRIGTYQNVLRQHDLYDCFDALAISEEIGVEKPDARIFRFALDRLAIPPADWSRVAMVGNNLARDIKGANALGLISIWFAWNERYPLVPADESERPDYQVDSAEKLRKLLNNLKGAASASKFFWPGSPAS